MNTAEERFEQIERYLRGQMSAAETAAFEAEIAADPGLDARVQQHRLERQGLELLIERDLMTKMQAWDRETEIFQKVQPRTAVIRPMTWIMRAAAVLLLAAFGYWLLQENATSIEDTPAPIARTKPEVKPRVPTVRKPQSRPPHRSTPAPAEPDNSDLAVEEQPAPIEEMQTAATDYAALADSYYNQQDFVLPKGAKGGTAGSASYNQALEKFRDGKYTDVVTNLKPDISIGQDAVQQKELLALSHYQSGQYENALSYFRQVADSGKQPYAQRADWGMVLTLLHQMPAKKPLLDRVLAKIQSDPNHQFYNKAKDLEAQIQK
ncbi:MAG: hypothetical protein EP344_02365 [Bacteroidetes bacterium]|nr:MAG: hypothetical protein EP344_02365 [Bacteroidota bacterium]